MGWFNFNFKGLLNVFNRKLVQPPSDLNARSVGALVDQAVGVDDGGGGDSQRVDRDAAAHGHGAAAGDPGGLAGAKGASHRDDLGLRVQRHSPGQAGSGFKQRSLIDRPVFCRLVKARVFGDRLSQSQEDGIKAVLDRWDCGPDDDLRWLAYALATTMHETARTMQPIRERGGADYFFRMYDPGSPVPRRAVLAKSMEQQPGDGRRYYGRGYVQLTWRRNYRVMGDRLKMPLEADPDLALRPDVAADIMFLGMRERLFTGVGFAQYFNGSKTDWVGARRIINGTDRAAEIGRLGQAFYDCIGMAA